MPAPTTSQFADYLRFGKEWEWLCYELLKGRFPDIRPPKTLEQALALGAGAVDEEPDMQILGFPVECKRRRFHFTGKEDFPYQHFYIDEEYKLRDPRVSARDYNALPPAERLSFIKPFFCYLTANADLTHMGVVIPASKPYWTLDRRRLRRDDREGQSWACRIDKVLFCEISQWRSILTWV
jgi:hypothetical protein